MFRTLNIKGSTSFVGYGFSNGLFNYQKYENIGVRQMDDKTIALIYFLVTFILFLIGAFLFKKVMEINPLTYKQIILISLSYLFITPFASFVYNVIKILLLR